jgi:hypothetical protein
VPLTRVFGCQVEELKSGLSQTRDEILNDPAILLQRRIFDNQIKEIKNYLEQQPAFVELSVFKPLVEVCRIIGIEPRWCLAASLLSSLEWFLKTWLTRNSEETLDTLKSNNIDQLISKIEHALNSKNISYKQLILSDIAGKRHFRNKVIHDLTSPHESEISEIEDHIKKLVSYMESLKPSSDSITEDKHSGKPKHQQ